MVSVIAIPSLYWELVVGVVYDFLNRHFQDVIGPGFLHSGLVHDLLMVPILNC